MYGKKSHDSTRLLPNMSARDQACMHIRASVMFGAGEHLCALSILPLVLKADSDATVVTGMASIL